MKERHFIFLSVAFFLPLLLILLLGLSRAQDNKSATQGHMKHPMAGRVEPDSTSRIETQESHMMMKTPFAWADHKICISPPRPLMGKQICDDVRTYP